MIYNEDCLIGMDKIKNQTIDMILCDLPYGTTRNKWDSIIPLDKLWEQYERIIKDNGAIVLTAQSPFDKLLGCSNLKLLRYEWIWEKSKTTGYLNAKKMPMKAHENILIFYKKLPVYNPQGMRLLEKPVIRKGGGTGPNYDSAEKDSLRTVTGYPKDILRFDSVKNPQHPTQKPLALFEYMINTYSNKNDLILDNCMGSGTTAIACLEIGRNYIGFELEKNYYDLSIERINEYKKEME